VITAAPLLCFASAARRLPLSTLGFFQYVAPSLSFLIAVGVYHEPFGRAQAIAFACVWTARSRSSRWLRGGRWGRWEGDSPARSPRGTLPFAQEAT
jgi:hypothetical protein